SHIDRPNLPGWEEMAGVWKASAEWVDESTFDTQDELDSKSSTPHGTPLPSQQVPIKERMERLGVGRGGTICDIDVYTTRASRTAKDRNIGSVEVDTM